MVNCQPRAESPLRRSCTPHFLRISGPCGCIANMNARPRMFLHPVDSYCPSAALRAGLAAVALLAAATVAAQTPATGVNGVWIDHTGQGAVEIGPCGNLTCGRVVWLKNPNHKSKS